MENREKDKNKSSSAEFGQKVGRSENLEGGNMRNRNEENIGSSKDSEVNESSRRPGSSYDSSSGRSGSSTGSMGNKNSGSERMRDDHEISRDDLGRSSGSKNSSSE